MYDRFAKPKKIKKAKEYFGQLKECAVTSSGAFNLEITSAGVDKGASLNKLCEHYGTDAQNAIAIGDNLNDLPMFHASRNRDSHGKCR